MDTMERARLQLSVSSLLALVACTAFNIWLFRLGVLWGLIGLNIFKHVVIALLCKGVGVDRTRRRPAHPSVMAPAPAPAEVPAV